MLNMIDELNKQLKEKDHAKLWSSLIDGENSPITFTVLDMKEFKLGDELYMRMNARGLPLSDFENFKAWLECELGDKLFEVKNSQGWKTAMDQEWTNLFWRWSNKTKKQEISTQLNQENDNPLKDPKKTGDLFFQYFKAVALNSYILSGDIQKIEEEKESRDFIATLSENRDRYIDEQNFANKFKLTKEEIIQDAFRYLDLATSQDNGLPEINIPLFRGQKNPSDWLKNGFTAYSDRILFFAYYLYVLQWKSNGLNNWMRVIRNLVLNPSQNIDSPGRFYDAIKSVKKIFNQLSTNPNVFSFLSQENFEISFFSKEQVKEERNKAKLRTQSDEWKNLIEIAEDHPFFQGQIAFLLRTITQDNTIDWMPCDKKSLDTATLRWKNAQKYFGENGVSEPFAASHLLMRAFISRATQWEELLDIPYSNGKYTWRDIILKENNIRRFRPLLSLLEIKEENQITVIMQWLVEKSTLAENGIQKRVHEELYQTEMLSYVEDSSFLKRWEEDDALSKYTYRLMPYNAKADYKKCVIGMKRNQLLKTWVDNKKAKLLSGGSPPFFRGSSVKFEYNKKILYWNWRDHIFIDNQDKQLSLSKEGITEENLTPEKLDRLLMEFIN